MEILKSFPIYQVVGYKNVGKKTLMQKLISHFSSKDVEVGSLKQHGHSSPLKTVKGTDSFKHSEAGAKVAVVRGPNELQITVDDTSKIEQLLHLYSYFNIEMLLVEGFKKLDYPKIVLLKNENDLHLLDELSNIIAVGVRDESLIGKVDYFTFSLNQMNNEIDELAKLLK